MNDKLNIHSTIIPGGMTMEKWEAGGFSTFNHGNSDCSEEVSKAIVLFKKALFVRINELATIDNIDEVSMIESFINNYKP